MQIANQVITELMYVALCVVILMLALVLPGGSTVLMSLLRRSAAQMFVYFPVFIVVFIFSSL